MCGAARDGASTLATRGALRMSARDRRDQAIPSKPSTTENVRFDLTAIGYAVPAGRRTSLSLSPPLLLLLALDLARAGPGARLHPGPVGPFPRTPVAGKGVRPRDHTESPPPPRYPRPPGRPRTHGGRAGGRTPSRKPASRAPAPSPPGRSVCAVRDRPGTRGATSAPKSPATQGTSPSSELVREGGDEVVPHRTPGSGGSRAPRVEAPAPPRRPREAERGPVNP
ncbi:CocE/NonD family hydrolase C-terminal non-catalytic domain-containing protein [Streptomyces sp. LN704]|uniref:CocE/NonD family hydrolase C-terminal non-catalytic domain-containing protein n=1 Tax=Streptomyces sp. LN704 TaxID=3112982 RepID=UPI0037218DEA